MSVFEFKLKEPWHWDLILLPLSNLVVVRQIKHIFSIRNNHSFLEWFLFVYGLIVLPVTAKITSSRRNFHSFKVVFMLFNDICSSKNMCSNSKRICWREQRVLNWLLLPCLTLVNYRGKVTFPDFFPAWSRFSRFYPAWF